MPTEMHRVVLENCLHATPGPPLALCKAGAEPAWRNVVLPSIAELREMDRKNSGSTLMVAFILPLVVLTGIAVGVIGLLGGAFNIGDRGRYIDWFDDRTTAIIVMACGFGLALFCLIAWFILIYQTAQQSSVFVERVEARLVGQSEN